MTLWKNNIIIAKINYSTNEIMLVAVYNSE